MKQINDWKFGVFFRNGMVFITREANKNCGAEIEINLPLDVHQAEEVISIVVEYCKKSGKQLSESTELHKFNREVQFRKRRSLLNSQNEIWRMVISDNLGRFPDDPDCEEGYKYQLSEDNGIGEEEFRRIYFSNTDNKVA